jgi:hypothetical protein
VNYFCLHYVWCQGKDKQGILVYIKRECVEQGPTARSMFTVDVQI